MKFIKLILGAIVKKIHKNVNNPLSKDVSEVDGWQVTRECFYGSMDFSDKAQEL